MYLRERTRLVTSIIREFIRFDGRSVFFAVNNVCNSKCKMCSIWKNKNGKNVKYEDAKKALDILHKNKFRAVQLTGGEPFLNPDIFKIIKYAKKLNFFVLIPTNGSLITEEIAEKIAKNRVDQTNVSFHHTDPKIFEKIENHKNIFEKSLNAIQYLKEKKAHVSALCTITRYNMNDIEKIVNFIENFKTYISFCIPVKISETSFSLGGDDCTNLTKNELKNVVSDIIELKKSGHKITNNIEYLRDVIESLDGKSRYPCYGGSKLFYLDWNLNFYPCMSKGVGKRIEEVSFDNPESPCNDCLIQCFREPSLFLDSRRGALKTFFKDIKSYFRTLTNV